MAKGAALVSVLIPKYCDKAMIMLADKKNMFPFAYTQMSEDGTAGYNEIMRVCQQISITVITATVITW